MTGNGEIIKLLWTGGWDSSFRLLQSVLLEGKKVQPYYLLCSRESLEYEKKAMASIKEGLFSRFPASQNLVLPTISYDIAHIKENNEITQNYRSLASRIHLGLQFDWLARLCHHERLEKIEMGIESGGANEINRELEAVFKPGAYELDEKHAHTDVYKVFRFFRFPLVDTTKLEMKKIAGEAGFLDLLELSWFCLHPIKGKPCGRCNPCVGTIKSGLGYRVPLAGHLRYYRRLGFDITRERLKRHPKFFLPIGRMEFLKALYKKVRR